MKPRKCKRRKKQQKLSSGPPTKQNRSGRKATSRRTHKGQHLNEWSEDNIENALREWKSDKKLSVRKMAKKWNIPYSSFFKRTKKDQITAKHLSGWNTVIPNASEDELACIIKTLSQCGFPLSKSDIQRIAFEFVTKNGMTGFGKGGSAGYVWFKGFMSCHQELRVRKLESLCAARASGANESVVMNWF